MSTRYEWINASHARVDFVPNGHDVDTLEPAGDDSDDYTVERGVALLLSYDEAVVLTGSVDELRDLLNRARAKLDSATDWQRADAATQPRIEGTFYLTDGTPVSYTLNADGTSSRWGQPDEILGTTVDTLSRMADVFVDEYVEPRTCRDCGIPVDSKPGADEHRYLGDLLCEDCGRMP